MHDEEIRIVGIFIIVKLVINYKLAEMSHLKVLQLLSIVIVRLEENKIVSDKNTKRTFFILLLKLNLLHLSSLFLSFVFP